MKNSARKLFSWNFRSRFGKALVPKHGLISNVIEAVQQNIIQDVYLVPVSYTYDNIAEGIFLNELMGIPKVGFIFDKFCMPNEWVNIVKLSNISAGFLWSISKFSLSL